MYDMIKTAKRHIKDIVIAGGVFVPLIDYIHRILQNHPGGVNVLNLPHSQQLILLALVMAPLLILRLVYAPAFCRRNRNN